MTVTPRPPRPPRSPGLCSFVRTHRAATVITFRGTLRTDAEAAAARALDAALHQLDSAVGQQHGGVVIADLSEATLPSPETAAAFVCLLGRRVSRHGISFTAVASPADLTRALTSAQ